MPSPGRHGPPPSLLPTGFQIRAPDLLVCAVLAATPIVAAYLLVTDLLSAEPAPVSTITIYIVWSGVYAFSLIGAVWVVFTRWRGASLAALGWIGMPWRRRLLAVAIGWGAFFIAWFAFFLVEHAGGQVSYYAMGIGAETSAAQVSTMLLLMGIVGPAAEELFYRGILFRWFRQRLSFWYAAVASAVLFGFAHIQPDAMLNAAFAGIVFAALYERSGSLLMPTLAHQTWNCTHIMITWLTELSRT